MPVIKVLLVRHGRLINLAKKVQLNRRELELCSTTLSVVLDFAWDRTTSLAGWWLPRVLTEILTYIVQRAFGSKVWTSAPSSQLSLAAWYIYNTWKPQ